MPTSKNYKIRTFKHDLEILHINCINHDAYFLKHNCYRRLKCNMQEKKNSILFIAAYCKDRMIFKVTIRVLKIF